MATRMGSLVNRFAAGDEASDRTALAQAREDNDSVPWEQVKVDLPEGPGGMSACAGRFMRTSSE